MLTHTRRAFNTVASLACPNISIYGPALKKWGLYWICLVLPSLCHSVIPQHLKWKIFVTIFSGIVRPRRLKLGTNVDSGQMYRVYRNQAATAYSSLYFFNVPLLSQFTFYTMANEKNDESRHDKTNKLTVRPAKTQISLSIRPVWSESSLSASRKLGSVATYWAHSEDSDQTGRMPRRIWVFAGRTAILLVLSCRGSNDKFQMGRGDDHIKRKILQDYFTLLKKWKTHSLEPG